MKKRIALLLAMVTLFAFSIPTFAQDYEHMMSGYGSRSGTDLGNASWSLTLTPYYAESIGYLFNGYTGNVHCAVATDSTWLENDTLNWGDILVYGNGNYAEVWFYNVA